MFEFIKNLFKKNTPKKSTVKAPFSSDKYADKDFLKISEYQLVNLITNPVKFLMLDLRSKNINPHFVRSEMGTLDTLIDVLKANEAALHDAIVVICEDGQLSEKAARKLVAKGYKNVVILEGGTQKLSAEVHSIQDMYYLLHKKK